MELLLTNLAHGFGVALSLQNLSFALLGALIGTAIDRRDGDSGIKGIIVGTIAEGAIRLLAPVVAT